MSEEKGKGFGDQVKAEWEKLSYSEQEDLKNGCAVILVIVFLAVVILLTSWFLLGLAGSGGFGYAVAFLIVCVSLGANLAHWLRL